MGNASSLDTQVWVLEPPPRQREIDTQRVERDVDMLGGNVWCMAVGYSESCQDDLL